MNQTRAVSELMGYITQAFTSRYCSASRISLRRDTVPISGKTKTYTIPVVTIMEMRSDLNGKIVRLREYHVDEDGMIWTPYFDGHRVSDDDPSVMHSYVNPHDAYLNAFIMSTQVDD